MKPQRFEIGQAITLKHEYKNAPVQPGCIRPAFGQVYHVSGYALDTFQGKPEWWITLEEHPKRQISREADFDPVVTDAVLSKELESITKQVEV